jgi:hypothetical protein
VIAAPHSHPLFGRRYTGRRYGPPPNWLSAACPTPAHRQRLTDITRSVPRAQRAHALTELLLTNRAVLLSDDRAPLVDRTINRLLAELHREPPYVDDTLVDSVVRLTAGFGYRGTSSSRGLRPGERRARLLNDIRGTLIHAIHRAETARHRPVLFAVRVAQQLGELPAIAPRTVYESYYSETVCYIRPGRRRTLCGDTICRTALYSTGYPPEHRAVRPVCSSCRRAADRGITPAMTSVDDWPGIWDSVRAHKLVCEESWGTVDGYRRAQPYAAMQAMQPLAYPQAVRACRDQLAVDCVHALRSLTSADAASHRRALRELIDTDISVDERAERFASLL